MAEYSRSARAARAPAHGWTQKRKVGGSHVVRARAGWPDYVWSFHDRDEIGPKMLPRIAKHTGLQPEDL